MPPITAHQSTNTTKMLFIGDSGAGKSGALASLAAAGYNLRILDLDNGLDVLKNYLTDPTSMYVKQSPDCASRVEFLTITDPMKSVNGKLMPKAATAWTRAVNMLNNWKYEYTLDGNGRVRVLWDSKSKTEAAASGATVQTVDFGPLSTWGAQDILVIDTLTTISQAAMGFIASLNGRLGQKPYQSDYGEAQVLVENLLQMLYDENIRCNIIVNCHITYIGEENGPQRGYPSAVGKALPPKVGRYFNSALMARSTGSGTGLKRKILTNTAGIIDLKNTAPTKVQPDYPLETGLADYFKAVRS